MDRETARKFREEFNEWKRQLEEKFGVVIEIGSITYDFDSLKCQLTAKEGGSKEEVQENDFNKYCRQFGLAPEDLHRRFRYRNEMYEIIGIRPNKRKYPILCQKISDGSTILFTTDVKLYF